MTFSWHGCLPDEKKGGEYESKKKNEKEQKIIFGGKLEAEEKEKNNGIKSEFSNEKYYSHFDIRSTDVFSRERGQNNTPHGPPNYDESIGNVRAEGKQHLCQFPRA